MWWLSLGDSDRYVLEEIRSTFCVYTSLGSHLLTVSVQEIQPIILSNKYLKYMLQISNNYLLQFEQSRL